MITLTELAAAGAHATGHAAALLEDLHVKARIGKCAGTRQAGNAGANNGYARVCGEGMGHGGLLARADILPQMRAASASVSFSTGPTDMERPCNV
jgi:hypothetical protein